jgi:hypothetical protein
MRMRLCLGTTGRRGVVEAVECQRDGLSLEGRACRRFAFFLVVATRAGRELVSAVQRGRQVCEVRRRQSVVVQDSRSWLSARPDPLAPRSVPRIESRHASRGLRESCNQLARGCTWPRLGSPHTFCHSQLKVYKNNRSPRELLRCPYSANRIPYRPSPQSHFDSAGLCSRGSTPRIAP